MEFLIIIGLILLNGIFAMSEIAVISARKSHLAMDAKRGNKRAESALRLAENPDRFLSTVQVGITLTGIVTGLYSGDVLAVNFSPLLENWGLSPKTALSVARIVIVITVTYLTIIFGELVPKRIGMTASEKVSKMIAIPMHWLSVMAYPFVWLLSRSTSVLFNLLGINDRGSKVTEEEIKLLINEGREDGEVKDVEQDIMERVFTLGDRDIESIMTPRGDIVWINTDMDKDEIKELISRTPFDKYPVGEGNFNTIIGIAFIKDMFIKIDADDFDIRDIVRPATYLYKNMEVYAALEKMKTDHIQFALVSDEFGTIKGMVTLIDIMEALVGDIPDPNEEPGIVARQEGGYIVDGQYSFCEFLEYFGLTNLYSQYDYNTISGLILEQAGSIPEVGDIIYWHPFSFEIVDMDGVRIDKLLVRKEE
jgi:putative hemolysin